MIRVPMRGRFFADIVDFSIAANIQADARLFSTGMPLHDPLAAAVAVDPSLVECFDLPMKVETETGDFHGTRGRTIGDPAGAHRPIGTTRARGAHREPQPFCGGFHAADSAVGR